MKKNTYEKKVVKKIIKGYAIWISNNALLFMGIYSAEGAIVVQSTEYIIATIIISLLWFATGHCIVSRFCMEKIEHVKLEPIGMAEETLYKEEK